MSLHGTLDHRVLADIIERIVGVAQPQRIIMFGSAAEGRMGPHSDVDLLVISHQDENRGQVIGDIYLALHGVGQAVDVIMVTPEEVERYKNVPHLIVCPALKHGLEVYRAGTPSARRSP